MTSKPFSPYNEYKTNKPIYVENTGNDHNFRINYYKAIYEGY